METVIRRRSRSALYVLSASLLSFTSHSAIAAGVLPTGGNFAAGSGKISSTANTLTVNQTTKNGIINWTGFSIGQGDTVRINNGSGATLNRVTGTSPSSIAGWLTSSGSTYLVNQNGIVVTPSGQVITGGSFVGSTRDTSNSAFMQGGNLEFTGTSSGTVTDQGSIAAAGDAVLIGKSATNSGNISAANGTVGVVAGDDVVLQPSGSGLQIEVRTGSGNATNSGNVTAAQALIDAAGGNAYALAGNNGGLVRATGTKNINGHVWLTAGDTAQVTGTVDAQNANGSGGAITVAGQTIDVSGALNANDTASKGNGGNITVGSPMTPSTTVTGTLRANAGAKGGNGGQVETSGELLNTSGIKVDTTAPKGQTGNWTLDPYNVSISSSSTSNNGLSSGTFTPSGNNSVIGASDLQNALQTTNVTVTTGSGGSQIGDISVAAPLTWSANVLTLDAYHSINIGAPISATGTAGLTLKTNDGGSSGDIHYIGGNITFANTSEALTINGTAFTLILTMGQMQAINNNLNGNYALANSINAATDPTTPASWLPLGTTGVGNGVLNAGQGFAGIFDGLGNTISNLTISMSSSVWDVGLFGYSGWGFSGGNTIRNIGLIGFTVSGGYDVGALTGNNGAYGTISNAFATAAVSTPNNTAGDLVGFNQGTITSSHAGGTVNATSSTAGRVGGLAGYNTGTISQSYATSNVSNGYEVGGLVGSNSGLITNSYATGSANAGSSGDLAGGLAGDNLSGGTIINSYASGTVAVTTSGNPGYTQGEYAGGLVGENYGTISQSYATGSVSGYELIGGLVGYINGGTVTNSYATGNVSLSNDFGGGLAGFNYQGSISYSYATGSVSGGFETSYFGGLVGANSGSSATISYSYATGSVGGTGYNTDVGGFWGYNFGGSASNSGSETTAQLIAALPNGFSSSLWGNANNQTTPYLIPNPGPVYLSSDSSRLYTVILTVGQLQAINASSTALAGNYALANSLNAGTDPTTPVSWTPIGTDGAGNVLNSGAGFTGIFDGLGNTISNLTISRPSANYVGLFGYSSGTIRNIGVVGASVGGNLYIGGLAGDSRGTITNAYSTGTISGLFNGGGLVGENDGSISNSYSTAAVSTTGFRAGGLAGTNAGSITNAYATGAVSSQEIAGGLIGLTQGGSITDVYSTGVVNSGGFAEGLIGYNNGGTLTNGYWDTQSSGQLYSEGGVGLTTAQLQGTLPAGFSSSVWGVAANRYPWLLFAPPPVIGVTAALTGSVIKTYDGALLATLSQNNYSLSGVLSQDNGDVTLTVNGAPVTQPTTGTFSQKDVGNNLTVTVTGLGLNNSSSDIYQLTSTTIFANIGFINPASLTVTANPQTKVYSNNDPALTYSASGFQTGDSITSVLSGSLARADYGTLAGEQVGNYAITQGTLAANPDYSIAFTGSTLSISPATLTVTANPQTKVYGISDPALTYSSSGFVNAIVDGVAIDDTASSVLSGALTRAAGENAGSYAITEGTLTSHNYTIAFTGSDLSITPAALTVTANPQSKVYGNNDPTLTYTASGLVNATVDGVAINDPAGSALSGALTRAAGENAGNYTITQGTLASNSNYTIAFAGSDLSIIPATLTIAANPQSKTYGTSDPTLTYGTSGLVIGTVDGVAINDTAGSVLSGAVTRAPGENAGSYAITQGSLAANSNYSIAFAGSDLSITPATLTVTANPQTKIYGTSDPTLAYGTSGLVNGTVDGVAINDTAGSALSGALTRASGQNVGSYAITQGGLAANSDYTIAFTGSTLSITPASLVISATGGSKIYDGTTASTLVPTYTGLVAGDGLTGLSETYNSKNVPTATTLSVSPYQLSDPSNYTVVTKTAPGTITPEALTVTASSQTKAYDGTTSSTSINPYSGAVISTVTPGVTSGAVYTAAGDSIAMSEVFTTANAGSATLKPSAAVNDGVGGADYSVTLQNASGTITQRPVALTGSRAYDGAANATAGILTIANVVAGDHLTLSGTGVLTGNGLTNDNQTPAFAGAGTLSLSGSSAANYTLANITTPVTVGSQVLNTVYISFSGVSLTGNLQGSNLAGLNLSGASLSGQNLTNVNLTGTNLSGAKLSGTNLSGATLTNADLAGATLTGANLSGASLAGSNLAGANLAGGNLAGDNLAGANLTGAILIGDNLSHDDLINAILVNADLIGANLSYSNLTGANLTGANLAGANLHGVTQ